MASKEEFIRQLAKFLCADEGTKSIELQMNKMSAIDWRDLRETTPLMGYYSGEDGMEKAVKELTKFLS